MNLTPHPLHPANDPTETAYDDVPAGVVTAAYLLEDALHLLLAGEPVEDLGEALPIFADDIAGQEHALEELQGTLTCLLSSRHAATCPADHSPVALVRRVHAVIWSGCVPTKDLRDALRYARRPNRRARHQLASDPEKWLRVMALVCAAYIAHYPDPLGFVHAWLADWD